MHWHKEGQIWLPEFPCEFQGSGRQPKQAQVVLQKILENQQRQKEVQVDLQTCLVILEGQQQYLPEIL